MKQELSQESLEQFPLATRDLPEGWSLATVADISDDTSPGFASGKHDSEGKGQSHMRPMNIGRNGRIDLTVVRSVHRNEDRTLHPGDVLFNNTNSPELVGKTALIGARENGFAFSNHMTRIRLWKEISPGYVAHYLHFLWMSGYMKHRCTNHVNQASISSKTLAQTVPLLLSPLNEQTRIVEKLEELLSDLDAGVAELKAAQRKLAQYRQSLLKAAVEGALTADWRAARASSDEPQESSTTAEGWSTGADLLQRILTERRARWETKQLAKFTEQGKMPPKDWQAKYPEPIVPDTTDLPALPDGWVWATLDQLLVQLRSGTAETSGRDVTPHPVLKSSAVRQGSIDLSVVNFLNQAQCRTENYLKPGDLLITRLSGSVEYVGCAAIVGGVAPASLQYPDRIFCGKLAYPSPQLATHIANMMRSPQARLRIEAAAKSTAGHKRISLSDLLPFPIPLPSQPEVVLLDGLMRAHLRQTEDAEAGAEFSLKQSAAQRKNILKAAFAGQLVPQDPNDEPASVLLERISAERIAAGEKRVGKTGRKTKERA